MRVLQRRREHEEYVERLLEQELSRAKLSPPDRALCQELVYGIVRWQKTLDWLIARKTAAGRTQNLTLQILLQLGLYQLFWLQKIPDHAAVNETVEIGKQFGFGPQAGFLNAILRGYTREREVTKKLLADIKTEKLALGFSHPEWLVERWQTRFGAEKTVRLLEWNNTPPTTFARVNTLKTDAEKLVERWREENVEYEFRRFDWTGENLIFELRSHPPLGTLPSFQEGLFYVQDPSTLLSVQELNPQPGETILDLCSAPGGKTTFIAQRMENRGSIVAQDSDAARLKLVQENCVRLGVTCVETMAQGDNLKSKIAGLKFDKILVDAPCSNSGVLRRRVDLRWRIRIEEISRLQKMQLDILRGAMPRLKPGGVLVYSTCSLEPEENSEVIKSFLAENSNFKLEAERQLLPFADGVDGAFVARLREG